MVDKKSASKTSVKYYPDRNVDKSIYHSGIPDQLPTEVTLQDVVASMPKDVFKKNMLKAWWSVAVTLMSVAAAEVMLYYSPWFLLPFAWAFAGTAFTGFFVIGHDCGHLSFARSGWLNDLVGTIAMMPLAYPFEPWRIQHNFHHNNTNKLHVDNAWQPFQPEYYASASPLERVIMRYIKGPLYWIASLGHMIKKHFFLSEFEPHQHKKVIVSLIAAYAWIFMAIPSITYYTGVWGLVKYWVVPWIGFHFWMSTFTMVHHTLPHIPFLPPDQWSDTAARLTFTVHCEYPRWIEYLCHHINVHIPHHVSTGIPSYNLRYAHNSLKAKWGRYLHETTFSWALIKDIIKQCHLYHEKECYVPFEHPSGELATHAKKQ